MEMQGWRMKLDRYLDRWAETSIFVALLMFVGIIAFKLWRRATEHPLTVFPQDWGQVGDFFGGMVNPMISLGALYMVVQAVSLQRTELKAAQRVLEKQARSAEETTQLAALSSLVDSALAEVQMHRDYLNFLVEQIARQDQAFNESEGRLHLNSRGRQTPDDVYPLYAQDGEVISRMLALRMISDINDTIAERMAKRRRYEHDIQDIMTHARARTRAEDTAEGQA